jgi:hypothetical protein
MRGPNVDYYNSGLSKTKQNHFGGKQKKVFYEVSSAYKSETTRNTLA